MFFICCVLVSLLYNLNPLYIFSPSLCFILCSFLYIVCSYCFTFLIVRWSVFFPYPVYDVLTVYILKGSFFIYPFLCPFFSC